MQLIFELVSAEIVLKEHDVFMISEIDITFFDVTQWYSVICKKWNSSERNHGVNLVLDLDQKVLHYLSIQQFSLSFSLRFKTPVDVLIILFNCSINMNFHCLWKTWFRLSRCLHASITFAFFTSFRWLFNLMWNVVSVFPTYSILQGRYSNNLSNF